MTVRALPSPADSAEVVREYLFEVLTSTHQLDEPQAREIASKWAIGRGHDLRSFPSKAYVDRFGPQFGWVFFQDVQTRLSENANNAHGQPGTSSGSTLNVVHGREYLPSSQQPAPVVPRMMGQAGRSYQSPGRPSDARSGFERIPLCHPSTPPIPSNGLHNAEDTSSESFQPRSRDFVNAPVESPGMDEGSLGVLEPAGSSGKKRARTPQDETSGSGDERGHRPTPSKLKSKRRRSSKKSASPEPYSDKLPPTNRKPASQRGLQYLFTSSEGDGSVEQEQIQCSSKRSASPEFSPESDPPTGRKRAKQSRHTFSTSSEENAPVAYEQTQSDLSSDDNIVVGVPAREGPVAPEYPQPDLSSDGGSVVQRNASSGDEYRPGKRHPVLQGMSEYDYMPGTRSSIRITNSGRQDSSVKHKGKPPIDEHSAGKQGPTGSRSSLRSTKDPVDSDKQRPAPRKSSRNTSAIAYAESANSMDEDVPTSRKTARPRKSFNSPTTSKRRVTASQSPGSPLAARSQQRRSESTHSNRSKSSRSKAETLGGKTPLTMRPSQASVPVTSQEASGSAEGGVKRDSLAEGEPKRVVTPTDYEPRRSRSRAVKQAPKASSDLTIDPTIDEDDE